MLPANPILVRCGLIPPRDLTALEREGAFDMTKNGIPLGHFVRRSGLTNMRMRSVLVLWFLVSGRGGMGRETRQPKTRNWSG